MTDSSTHEQSLEGQPVVITGGAGFIGHHSVAAALRSGAAVMVIDDGRHVAPTALPSVVEFVSAELSSQQAHDAIVAFKPAAILHLAAQGGVLRSFRDPVADAQANIIATLAVIAAARDANTKRIVFSSSGGALYGHAPHLPAPETTDPHPISPYGLAKWSCEQYLDLFSDYAKLSTMALRYGNVYGPLQDGTGEAGIVAITSRKLISNESPTIFGTGEQTRDFVYVGDIAEANMCALRSSATGALNVGTGIGTSINEVVEAIVRISQTGKPLLYAEIRNGEVLNSVLDVSAIHAILGWQAATALLTGLERTYNSFDLLMNRNDTKQIVLREDAFLMHTATI